MRALLLGTALLVGIPALASAEEDCDCSRSMGECGWERPVVEPGRITFKVSTSSCAQVIYYVGEDPGSVTVRYGTGYAPYSPVGAGDPVIEVRSCTICWTKSASAGGGDDLGGVSINVKPEGKEGDLAGIKAKVLELEGK